MSVRIEDCFTSLQEAIQRLQSLTEIDQEFTDWDDRLSQNLHRWNEATFRLWNDSEMTLEYKCLVTVRGIQFLAGQILLDRDPVLVSVYDGAAPMDRSVWEKVSETYPVAKDHTFANRMITWLSSLPQELVPERQALIPMPTDREIISTMRADLVEQENYRIKFINMQLVKMDEALQESNEKMLRMVEDYVNHHNAQVNELQNSFERRFTLEQEARKEETSLLTRINDELHGQTSILGEKVLDAQVRQEEFKHEIDRLDKTRVILSRQLDGAERSVQNLSDKVDGLRQDNLALEGNLNGARSSISNLQFQNGALYQKVATAEATMHQQKNLIQQLYQNLANLEREAAHLRAHECDDDGFCSIM